ncbi:MAG: type II secretion system protein [bacterium]|nr:type II secretion system protein [bacterium]
MEREKGFTLIELMVVVTILSILVSIFASNISGSVGRTAITTAISSVEQTEKDIDRFIATIRELPNRKDATTENYYTLLFTGMDSDGAVLTTVRMQDKQGVDKSTAGVLDIVDFPLVKRDNLYNHLLVNNRFYPACKPKKDYGWCESYTKLKGDMLDPWGNSYFAVFRDLGDDTTRVYVLSAGADKVLDTDPKLDERISPDDIGITWIARPPKS